jgi:hypothetical protein
MVSTYKLQGMKVLDKNVTTRCLLAVGQAVLAVYEYYGQVIPINSDLKKSKTGLYQLLVPCMLGRDKEFTSDANKKNGSTASKQFTMKELFAYCNPDDEDKVTNIPMLIAYIVKWACSKGTHLELFVPCYTEFHREKELMLDTTGCLNPKSKVGDLDVDIFEPLFYHQGTTTKYMLADTICH